MLRTKWEHRRGASDLAILSVDVELPTTSRATLQAHELSKSSSKDVGDDELIKSVHVAVMNLQGATGQDRTDLTETERELTDQLDHIRGVQTWSTFTYSIGIQRSSVFKWREIKPHVEAVIADWAGVEPPPLRNHWWQKLIDRLRDR